MILLRMHWELPVFRSQFLEVDALPGCKREKTSDGIPPASSARCHYANAIRNLRLYG